MHFCLTTLPHVNYYSVSYYVAKLIAIEKVSGYCSVVTTNHFIPYINYS